MNIRPSFAPASLCIVTASVLALALGGCLSDGQAYRPAPGRQLQTAGVYVDDYDYFPGYETYYSRSRHEYYYREGSTWVSRPQPPGVSAEVILAAPSVRMDFHDAPAQHHQAVVQSYPRAWSQKSPPQTQPQPPKAKDERKPDAKPERKDNRKDDKTEGPKDDSK